KESCPPQRHPDLSPADCAWLELSPEPWQFLNTRTQSSQLSLPRGLCSVALSLCTEERRQEARQKRKGKPNKFSWPPSEKAAHHRAEVTDFARHAPAQQKLMAIVI